MKLALTALLASTTIGGSAIAGDFETPAIPVAPLTVTDSTGPDWGGFYAGGMVSFDTGSIQTFDGSGNPSAAHDFEGSLYGIFAGYNFQHGSMVYGAELDYGAGDIGIAAFPERSIEYIFDAKARVGYVFGQAMVYGVAGLSAGHQASDGPDTLDFTGLNYGAGLEYKIGDHLFVGGEYLIRDVSGTFNTITNTGEINLQSMQLRVGWQF